MKKALRQKLHSLKDGLTSSLAKHFDQTLDGSIKKLEDNIAPYRRFISAQQDTIEKVEKVFQNVQQQLESSRSRLPLMTASNKNA